MRRFCPNRLAKRIRLDPVGSGAVGLNPLSGVCGGVLQIELGEFLHLAVSHFNGPFFSHSSHAVFCFLRLQAPTNFMA